MNLKAPNCRINKYGLKHQQIFRRTVRRKTLPQPSITNKVINLLSSTYKTQVLVDPPLKK